MLIGMTGIEILLGIGVLALIGLGIWYGWKKEQERRRLFQEWSDANNRSYAHGRNKEIYGRFGFLDRTNQGHSRYAIHVLEGEWQGREAVAFTFHYAVTHHDGKRTRTSHHYFGVTLMRLEKAFPELKVSPESFFHKIGHALGMQDIDFESIDFSKSYEVKCSEKKFAYDFFHTRMMEDFLAHKGTAMELEGEWIALFDKGKLEPHELEPCLDRLIRIREQMPRYLFKN